MRSLPQFFAANRGTLLLAGLAAFGAWLLAVLTVADFNVLAMQTLRTSAVTGKTIVDTQYNALGFFGLAVPVVTLLGGVALYLKRPVLRFARNLTQSPAERVATASETLGREIGEILNFARTQVAANETFGQSLGRAQKRLSGLSEAEQVRVVVSLLVAENERMRRDTTDVRSKIEARTREIEELQTDLDGVEQAVLQDPLTGVGNRRQFEMAMAAALKDSQELRTPLSLVMCDIDHFKKVNDVFGHQVGDEIIKMLARIIRTAVRDTDTVVRYGGEEFAIVLPKTGQEGALIIAERMRAQFEAKRLTVRETNQQVGQVTASFGVAELRPGESVDALVKRADAKLYEAKSAGRNRVARP